MGLAFYGRAFTLVDPGCSTPGCLFASGANSGPCSKEVSILMNSEIKNIIDTKGLTPTLHTTEKVKSITWDGQWVAYDDAQTLQMKLDFARGQCLGGVMVWAISHDTPDGLYSKALGQATGRVSPIALPQTVSDTTTTHDQCKWTNCGDDVRTQRITRYINSNMCSVSSWMAMGFTLRFGSQIVSKIICPGLNLEY